MTRTRIQEKIIKGGELITYFLEIYNDAGELEDRRERVAFLDPNHDIVYKIVDPDKHFFKKHNGYAMAQALIDHLNARENTPILVKIIESEDGKIKRGLKSDFEDWDQKAASVQYDDLEHQRVLDIEDMEEDPLITHNYAKNMTQAGDIHE